MEAQAASVVQTKTITYLIGNGFDVGMHMKSQYSDFYKLYTNKNSVYYPKDDDILAKVIRTAQENRTPHWSYYERWLGDYTEQHDKDRPEKKDALIRRNEAFQERFYAYLAAREEQLIFAMEDGHEKQQRLREVGAMMGRALPSFHAAENIGAAGHETVERALSPNAERAWGLKYQYQFLCFNYSSVLDNCLAAIPNGVVERLRPDGSWVNLADTVGRVHHVHGSLARRGDTVLVMGVNDIGQLGNEFGWESNPYRPRLVKRAIMDEQDHPEQYMIAEEMIRDSDVIVVYGMSLGDTDKDWWSFIHNWLSLDENHQLIFYVYDEKYNLNHPQKRNDIINEYLRKLREMVWGEDSAKKCARVEHLRNMGACPNAGSCPRLSKCTTWMSCRKRIHFAIHHNIFAKDLQIEPDPVR